MKNKWFRALIRRRLFMVLIVILQIVFMIYAILSSSVTYKTLSIAFRLISLIVCLNIVSKNNNSAFKLSWVFIILLFPLFGGLVYMFFKFQSPTKKMTKKIEIIDERNKKLAFISGVADTEAIKEYPKYKNQISYLQNHASFPVYKNTKTKYLSPGEEKIKYLLDELKKAEKYIFLEYFIISEGELWNSILEILKEKAANGVTVRVMYDDMGCFVMLPKDYPRQLSRYGIECRVFNPFKPWLTSVQNNRDHRKIAVIDGKVAFTGGINLADYYINLYEKHGHWKDAAIMLKGEGAWSFTLMFLKMWELASGKDEDISIYYPWQNSCCISVDDGYIQPYADSPMDKENIGENIYLQIINNAKEYVYINTPYLIIDDNMLSSLCLAAKSGVDVRIVTPHIWDKWAIHMTTRSYYKQLISCGVKVYEYTPGFIHSKTFVSDDKVATVGTANLDFRSLYLHFECGALMYGCKAVGEIKDDFLTTTELCREITLNDCKCSVFMHLFRNIMRIAAPLL